MIIDLIGVPLDLGSERLGVDMAPNALRYQKFVKNLRIAGLEIDDLGNIQSPSPEELEIGNQKIKYLIPITEVSRVLSKTVESSVTKGNKILAIGGDHSIAIGSVAGAKKASKGEIGIIWIDAHGDLNTPQTTPSGNLHGMPLAVLLGHGDKTLTNLVSEEPVIKYGNVLMIGLKDLDKPEIEFIEKNKLKAFYINDILAKGLSPVFEAITTLKKRTDNIWVSFDLDGVDAEEAPGVGMPNKGGLTYREIHAIAEYIGKECDILGLDLVEYNPVNDIQHKTAILATELTAKMFGKEFSSYSEYLHEHEIK